MKHIETPSMRQRLCAAITAGALAASTVGAPAMAFAATNEPSAEGHTGTGETGVYVQLPEGGTEVSGNKDPNNPDTDKDEDDYGDNIAFTVPTSINFVAKPSGEFMAPTAAATYIENESVFAIHASSMQVTATTGWNLVSDVREDESDKGNIFDLTFGPEADQLNAASYTGRTAVAHPDKWNMTYAVADTENHPSDRVELKTSGHTARVSNDIKAKTQIATIRTYVTQGVASA